MKVKIIMDSGKEYTIDGSIDDITQECYVEKTIPNPMGGRGQSFTQFVVKFVNISDDIVINTNHISSIEAVK